MGRQINFYMSKKVQNSFFEFLKDNEFVFLDYYSQKVLQPTLENVYEVYLYKKVYGDIMMNGSIMNTIKGPVIEFSKTMVKKEEKRIIRGRIWLSHQYYDDGGNIVKKCEEIVKDYEKLTRWIKKNVPYQEIKKGDYLIKEYANDEIIDLQNRGYEYSM